MKKPSLLIISDTRIQYVENKIMAFNSVVKELDVFEKLFNDINWVGFDYGNEEIDNTLLEVNTRKIKIITLKRTGGNSVRKKLLTLTNFPRLFFLIFRYYRNFDFIHVRGPSSPMFFALILSFIYRKPRWWFKYANNWNDSNSAWSWKIQKFLMRRNQNIFGTVNGQWSNLGSHIKHFENPCLDNVSGIHPRNFRKVRDLKKLLYVGRLDFKKGLNRIIETVDLLSTGQIESLTIIGFGSAEKDLMELLLERKQGIPIKFLGAQSKVRVFEEMLNSDFLLLPTLASEGFPKVIAEAWFNGCIPISSDVSCISQYLVDGENGFLWYHQSKRLYSEKVKEAISKCNEELNVIRENGYKLSQLFTYERYEDRIKKELFKI